MYNSHTHYKITGAFEYYCSTEQCTVYQYCEKWNFQMNITLATDIATRYSIFLSFLFISFLENFPSKYKDFQIDKFAKILEIDNAKNRLSVSSHCNFPK